MGFSVTSSYIVIVVALVSGASVLAATITGSQHTIDEGERAASRLREDRANTLLETGEAAAAPAYDAVADRFTVNLWNNGTTVLKVSEMEYLLDGVHAGGLVESDAVDGDATTDYWMPLQKLTVRFAPVTTAPARFAAFAENGAGAYWGT